MTLLMYLLLYLVTGLTYLVPVALAFFNWASDLEQGPVRFWVAGALGSALGLFCLDFLSATSPSPLDPGFAGLLSVGAGLATCLRPALCASRPRAPHPGLILAASWALAASLLGAIGAVSGIASAVFQLEGLGEPWLSSALDPLVGWPLSLAFGGGLILYPLLLLAWRSRGGEPTDED